MYWLYIALFHYFLYNEPSIIQGNGEGLRQNNPDKARTWVIQNRCKLGCMNRLNTFNFEKVDMKNEAVNIMKMRWQGEVVNPQLK